MTASPLGVSGALLACGVSAEDALTKVWLITGHCRALVQALAEAVLASGHNLVVTTIDTEPLKELVERYGDQLRILSIDVVDGPAAETAIEATIGAFGRLDVLVLDVAKLRAAIHAGSKYDDLTAAGGTATQGQANYPL
jgi:NADP-dependent 3-hydroxy acid dehydrogenase YdfG